MAPNRRLLFVPATVIVLGVATLIGVKGYLDHWAQQPLPIASEAQFVVPPGASFASVVETLVAAGVVSGSPFTLLGKLRGLQGSVKSGEYRLQPGDTPDQLLNRLVDGEVVLHRLRIAEGCTTAALLTQLAEDTRLKFDLIGTRPEDLLARLGLDDGHAEGRFFPDTYLFARGYAASALLAHAYAKMEETLAETWTQRKPDLPYETPYEALILASIVEKETAFAADRAKVAGVFVRRLVKGMRLQSDPTVIYGLGDEFDGNLTRRHLQTDGVYNTYRRGGLPPTPIALPSRASIDAALRPDDGEDLFFVSRGDGTSQFSKTLAEHNAAVRRYQLNPSR